MSHPKRAIHPPSRRSHEAVKPVPPIDLWQQMDKHLAEVAPIIPARDVNDPNQFTREMFQRKYRVTAAVARKKLCKLVEHGRIKRIGISKESYYVLINER